MLFVAYVADDVLGNTLNGRQRLLMMDDGTSSGSDGGVDAGQTKNLWRSNFYAPQSADVVIDDLPSDFYRLQRFVFVCPHNMVLLDKT